MNILLVHAHHEPNSFSSALAAQARTTLTSLGHHVEVSDLYADQFDPVSDRRNFSSVKDPGYLKQQVEEQHASEVGGFAPALETEIQKLERADLLIFSFPLWWFGMPAILKGWVDRVFPMKRIYGGPKLYEGGIGQARKRAMVLMTTGGPASGYDGWGVNPSLQTILDPIHHGVFWFNGFLPLDPYVAWSPVRLSPEQRQDYLDGLDHRLRQLDQEEPLRLPPLADFPNFGRDRLSRFLVHLKGEAPQRAPLDQAVQKLQRQSVILSAYLPTGATPWQATLIVRALNTESARQIVETLPGSYTIELMELSPP